MTKLNIFIENIYPQFSLDEKKVLAGAKKVMKYCLESNEVLDSSCLKSLDYNTLTFDIVFCDNTKIHEINREYREKDRATDVITFALFADSSPEERFIFDGEINLGEILISLDKTQEQAESNNHEFGRELFFLISHGIMHLLGYDHPTEEELNFMLFHQEKSVEKVNVKVLA